MAAAAEFKVYYVWLVAERDDFAEALVAKLVRRGFNVGALGRCLITQWDDNPAVIVAVSLFRTPRSEAERKEYNAEGIHAEVTDVIKQIKGKFWGIVVSAAENCTWGLGNISLAKEEAVHIENLKKVN